MGLPLAEREGNVRGAFDCPQLVGGRRVRVQLDQAEDRRDAPEQSQPRALGHPQADPERFAPQQLVRWTSFDGRTISGWLSAPPARFAGPRPVLMYVHGGAFRSLSKDTHWIMGLAFARRGFVVANVNYRLAPEHRFPAGLDVQLAGLPAIPPARARAVVREVLWKLVATDR